MRDDMLTLELRITVEYELGRTSVGALEQTLVNAAGYLYDNGLLSGETEADVAEWRCAVLSHGDAASPHANTKAAVDAIESDLSDRRGLRQAWDAIDDDVKSEIRRTWCGLVSRAIATPPRPGTRIGGEQDLYRTLNGRGGDEDNEQLAV